MRQSTKSVNANLQIKPERLDEAIQPPVKIFAAVLACVLVTGCDEPQVQEPVLTAAVKQPVTRPIFPLIKIGDSTAGNYLAGRLAQKNRDYGNAS